MFDSILRVYFCNTVTNLIQPSAFLSLLTLNNSSWGLKDNLSC